MTKRTFNCECNKVLKDGDGERCGECEGRLPCQNYKCPFFYQAISNNCHKWYDAKICCKDYMSAPAPKGDQP